LASLTAFADFSFTWESATAAMNPQTEGVPVVATIQFIGARFSLEDPVHLEQIGASFYAINESDTFFAAIVAFDLGFDLPRGLPFEDGEVLGSTILQPGTNLTEALASISLTLDPGNYGIVIGTGLYGASGVGGMPNNNSDHLHSSYFRWSDIPMQTPEWSYGGDGYRFLINGQVVPEPSTALLVTTGLIALMLKMKNRTTNASTVLGTRCAVSKSGEA